MSSIGLYIFSGLSSYIFIVAFISFIVISFSDILYKITIPSKYSFIKILPKVLCILNKLLIFTHLFEDTLKYLNLLNKEYSGDSILSIGLYKPFNGV